VKPDDRVDSAHEVAEPIDEGRIRLEERRQRRHVMRVPRGLKCRRRILGPLKRRHGTSTRRAELNPSSGRLAECGDVAVAPSTIRDAAEEREQVVGRELRWRCWPRFACDVADTSVLGGKFSALLLGPLH
jgi:hypothetical protein